MADCNIDHVIPRRHRGMTTRKNLVVACRGCNELKLGQLIPEELRPRPGEAFERRKRKLSKRGRKASRRMKERASIIREASAMGIYLDDLFPSRELKQ